MNLDRNYLKEFLEKDSWSIEEKEQLLEYLESNSIAELQSVAAEEFFNEVGVVEEFSKDLSSENVLSKIHQSIIVPNPSFFQKVMFHSVKLAVAASVVLIVGAFLLFWRFSNTNSRTVQLAQAETSVRKVVKLPDGSLVSMEPGSSLEYPTVFNGKKREVKLKGEAFFEIAKDAAHPFIVHTSQVNATVLGTSFNVKAYSYGNPKVEVVTGSVKVEVNDASKQWLVLSPNQSAVFNSSSGVLAVGDVQGDAQFYKSRQEGMFKYRGVALRKVVSDLQRFYNERITIKDEANACLFYGDFFVNDKLDKALNLIAISINAVIKKDKNGYLIVGGSCQ